MTVAGTPSRLIRSSASCPFPPVHAVWMVSTPCRPLAGLAQNILRFGQQPAMEVKLRERRQAAYTGRWDRVAWETVHCSSAQTRRTSHVEHPTAAPQGFHSVGLHHELPQAAPAHTVLPPPPQLHKSAPPPPTRIRRWVLATSGLRAAPLCGLSPALTLMNTSPSHRTKGPVDGSGRGS